MAGLDRDNLIELLGRLGSESDATVLEAGRAVHRAAMESGYRWDDILRPARDFVDEPLAGSSDSGTADADGTEVARLIDRIVRKGVSETLRNDLAEMKRQAAEGALDTDDARYLRALARRLGV